MDAEDVVFESPWTFGTEKEKRGVILVLLR